jgi:hypothetical protein
VFQRRYLVHLKISPPPHIHTAGKNPRIYSTMSQCRILPPLSAGGLQTLISHIQYNIPPPIDIAQDRIPLQAFYLCSHVYDRQRPHLHTMGVKI